MKSDIFIRNCCFHTENESHKVKSGIFIQKNDGYNVKTVVFGSKNFIFRSKRSFLTIKCSLEKVIFTMPNKSITLWIFVTNEVVLAKNLE